MTDTLPTFAVVGHPNKGKSSIVATLAEDDRVAISPVPGTTRSANRHTFRIDGEPLYQLIDTPGFQRPGELLSQLKKEAGSASDRAAAVAAFVDAHRGDARFHDECELLTPLIEGAGILYVVDGAKPYGAEYEVEMEILRWTGRPRMALINRIGDGDFEEDWRQALDQYFSIVRVFDALSADFDKRVSLLRAFAELDEDWRPSLDRAVEELVAERDRRRQRSANAIASLMLDVLTATERESIRAGIDTGALKSRLLERLQNRIGQREQAALEHLKTIYGHGSLDIDGEGREAAGLPGSDIFTSENWEVFGLSRNQLAMTGAVSGAAAGSGVDLALGGTSLFLGAGLGALIGSAGAWLGSGGLARVKTVAGSLGERIVQVGPVTAANFPWVVLGRAWLGFGLIAERNHARRDAIALAVANESHLMGGLPDDLRRDLARSFSKISRGDAGDEVFESLAGQIERLLAHRPAEIQSTDQQ